ncbi:MAG: hypothetical protein J6D45_07825 [Clostridia bacterium]|nr:hypothetical protein [Clostridia bacterium]
MGKITLYSIACEMLRQTNPYKKDVSKISYQNDGEAISLLDIVKQKLSSYRGGARNYSKNNLRVAYDAISEAMEDYLYGFHSSFCFKQNVKKKFHFWLKAIQQHYRLESTETPFEIDLQSYEQDTCIAMLKALHSRDGVSEYDFPDIKPRSVRQNLRKLSPGLYKGEKENIQEQPEYVPFRIGGQQVTVDIRIKKRNNDRKQYYYTPNTVHPIVLQENLMQVGALLKALCNSYYNPQRESWLGLLIAIDIWSQLSDYAKEKMKNVYAIGDQDFCEFIEILDDGCPDNYASTYHTEREMAEAEGLSKEDKLLYLAKAPERTATIVATTQDNRVIYIKGATVKDYGDNAVSVHDSDNIERILTIANIRDIVLN